MRKRIIQGMVAAGVLALVVLNRSHAQSNPNGDPDPSPCDPVYGSAFCVHTGRLAPNYVFGPANIAVNVGQTIVAPTASHLVMTNGLQAISITYPCGDQPNGYATNAIPYTFGSVYFVPSLPTSLATAGTYTYTGMVVATGSPCAPVTNTLGTVTVYVNALSALQAVNDTATVPAGVPTTIDVLANDTDPNGPLTITGFTQGAHGTVAYSADHKTLIYTPGTAVLSLVAPPVGQAFTVSSVNIHGLACGLLVVANGNTHAALWNIASGVVTDLDPTGTYSVAECINDSGTVVGYMTVSGAEHAFKWATGQTSLTDVHTLVAGTDYPQSVAYGINNSGQICGQLFGVNPQQAYFLDSNNSVSRLDPFGGSGITAYAINNSGRVVGEAETVDLNPFHAFQWQPGDAEPTDLNGLFAVPNQWADSVNAQGDMAGYTAHFYNQWAFVIQNGVFVDLSDGYWNSYAFGLNSSGQVVGAWDSASTGYSDRALCWEGNQAFDLNNSLLPGSGWVLNDAVSINENGLIVGDGTYQGAATSFATQPPASYVGPDTFSYTVSDGTLSATAVVNVNVVANPLIIGPNATAVTYGNDATFSVMVTGTTAPVHYQWQKIVGGVPQNVGANLPYYTVVNPAVADTGATYDVLVTSGTWSATSPPATLTVNPAALNVTANGQGMTYGQTLTFGGGSTQFTASGLQNGDTVGTVTLFCSGGAATTAAGSYPITPSALTGGTFTAANYNITYNAGTLTVNPAPLSITPYMLGKTYGFVETFGSGDTSFLSSGLQNGETIGSVTLTCSGGAGTAAVGSYPVTLSAATGGTFTPANYTITYNPGSLVVSRATLNIIARPQSKTYGQTLAFGSGNVQFNAVGLQNGETVMAATLASGGGVGTAPVGSYTITASSVTGGTFSPGNYIILYSPGTLTVNPATLSLTASAQSKTYGQTLTFGSGSTQFTSGGLQNGETIGTVTLACSGGTATTAAGSYPITPSALTGGTFAAANYTITYTAGSLTVSPAALNITANAQSKTYGQTLTFGSGSTQFTSGGLQNSETIGTVTLTCSGGAGTTGVGSYAITPSAPGGGTFTPANYTITYLAGSLTVNRAALNITASAQSKTYGQTLTFAGGGTQFSSGGLQNSETIGTVTLACSGGPATTVVGSYTITPSAATGGTFAAANYNITYNTGSLTVSPAALIITANGQGKVYGQALTFGSGSAQFSAGGLQNSETVGTVTLACSGGPATATAGSYPITPGALIGGTFAPANYNIIYNAGTLTVSKVPLTVTADNKVMGYGQAVPSLTYVLAGFVNGENSSVVGGAPALSTTVTATTPAGIYPITANLGTLSAANYTFTLQNGTITVESVVIFAATQLTAVEVGLVPGTFTVSRTDAGAALTVSYTITGTAAGGTDYQTIANTVTILAGSTTAPIPITPLLNGNTGVGSRTVILTLGAGAGNYVLGAPASTTATCTIMDSYGDSDNDGLADAMEAVFGGTPLVANPGWKTDGDNDGIPDSIDATPGTTDAAPVLPSFGKCPLP